MLANRVQQSRLSVTPRPTPAAVDECGPHRKLRILPVEDDGLIRMNNAEMLEKTSDTVCLRLGDAAEAWP